MTALEIDTQGLANAICDAVFCPTCNYPMRVTGRTHDGQPADWECEHCKPKEQIE